MNSGSKQFAIAGMRRALGLVVLMEPVHYAFSPSAASQLANSGLPRLLRPGLGGNEIVAAQLFLIPGSRLAGGYVLLFLLMAGAVIQIRHDKFSGGNLIVYFMAVIVCMVHSNKEPLEASNDR